MPVTKTAKRALRSSEKKRLVNASILSKLEIAIRVAKKAKSNEKVVMAIALADRARAKKVIHKNKAARIKSALSKLLRKENPKKPPKVANKTSIKKLKRK